LTEIEKKGKEWNYKAEGTVFYLSEKKGKIERFHPEKSEKAHLIYPKRGRKN